MAGKYKARRLAATRIEADRKRSDAPHFSHRRRKCNGLRFAAAILALYKLIRGPPRSGRSPG